MNHTGSSSQEKVRGRQIVDRVDESIWRALFDGHFRLALKCDVCGRWITANSSKKAGRGPRCAAKQVSE